MRNEVELVIKSRSEAQKGVDDFKRQMGGAQGDAEKFGRGLRDALQPAQVMSETLLSKLNPALGGAVGQMSAAAGSARNLTPVLGAVTVGVTALTVAAGFYIDKLKDAQDFQAKFNVAVKSADLGALRGMLNQNSEALERYNVLTKQAGQSIDTWKSMGEVIAAFWQKFFGDEKEVDRRAEKLRKLMAPLLFTQSGIAAAGVESQAAGVRGGTAAQRLATAVEQGRGYRVTDPLLDEMEREARTQAGADRDRIRAEMDEEFKRRRSAGLMTQDLELLRERQLKAVDDSLKNRLTSVGETRRRVEAAAVKRLSQRLDSDVADEFTPGAYYAQGFGAMTPEEQSALSTGRELNRQRAIKAMEDMSAPTDFEGGAEAVGGGPTTAETSKGILSRNQSTQELLELERSITQVMQQRSTLTADERDQIDLMVIAAERLARLEEAKYDVDKQINIELETSVRTLSKMREIAERTDFSAGMAKGFREWRDEVSSLGVTGERAFRDFASMGERVLSDTLFIPTQKKWKETFRELPERYLSQLQRLFADYSARLALGTIFRGVGGGGGSLLSAIGFGGGGGGGAINLTGASPQQIATLAQNGYQVTAGPGGGLVAVPAGGAGSFSYANAIPTPPLSMFTGGPGGAVGGFLNAPIASIYELGVGSAAGFAQLGAAGATAADLAALGATGAEIAAATPAASAGTLAGVTVGSVVGSAAAAAGFAYSLYGAYQSGSPGYGALSGGISGAIAGAVIAAGLGLATFGVGAVVGLVAGAALGAGAGALGKKGAKKTSPHERSRQAAEQGAANLSSALDQARGLEQVLAIMNTRWTPLGAEVQIVARNLPPEYYDPAQRGGFDRIQYWIGDYDDPSPFLWRAEDLLDPVIVDHLTVWTGPGGAAAPNGALTQKLKDTIRRALGNEAAFSVGYLEQFGGFGVGGIADVRLGPGQSVTRATVVPMSELHRMRGRAGLFTFEEQIANLSDQDATALLLKLQAADLNNDLRILRIDEQATVVTSRLFVVPPPPPPPTPPAPAPAVPEPSPNEWMWSNPFPSWSTTG